MNARVKILLSSLLCLPLVGCLDDRDKNETVFEVEPPGSRFGYKPPQPAPTDPGMRRDETTNPIQDPANDPLIDPLAEGGAPGTGAGPGESEITGPEIGPQPDPGPTGTGTTPPPAATVPFAAQVPGMSGYVWSPFAPGKKVEVIGYPPGTKVKCPYTGKEFKVP